MCVGVDVCVGVLGYVLCYLCRSVGCVLVLT